MTNVEIFGFAPSTYVRTARMAASEKGVPHTLSPLNFQSDAHVALHPFAKMPILRHGKVVLHETMAIATYLDGMFDGPPLQPSDPLQSAFMWQLVSIANDCAYPALVKDTLDETGLEGADQTAISKMLDCLERSASVGSLQAKTITLADLFISPMVGYHVDLAGASSVFTKRPRLRAWYDEISSRSSFSETAPT